MAVSGISSANDLQQVHKGFERGADLVNDPNTVRSDAAILGMSSDGEYSHLRYMMRHPGPGGVTRGFRSPDFI